MAHDDKRPTSNAPHASDVRHGAIRFVRVIHNIQCGNRQIYPNTPVNAKGGWLTVLDEGGSGVFIGRDVPHPSAPGQLLRHWIFKPWVDIEGIAYWPEGYTPRRDEE